jgi:hypothetical protein
MGWRGHKNVTKETLRCHLPETDAVHRHLHRDVTS